MNTHKFTVFFGAVLSNFTLTFDKPLLLIRLL